MRRIDEEQAEILQNNISDISGETPKPASFHTLLLYGIMKRMVGVNI